MATLTQIRDKADTVLVDLWNLLLDREESYYAKHGRYFGFNWSPSTKVVDGVDTAFVLNPPSRFFEAADVNIPAGDLPFQIQVIRHEGPEGHGFTAWVRVELLNGDVYYRLKGHGFHSETRGWFKEIKD